MVERSRDMTNNEWEDLKREVKNAIDEIKSGEASPTRKWSVYESRSRDYLRPDSDYRNCVCVELSETDNDFYLNAWVRPQHLAIFRKHGLVIEGINPESKYEIQLQITYPKYSESMPKQTKEPDLALARFIDYL